MYDLVSRQIINYYLLKYKNMSNNIRIKYYPNASVVLCRTEEQTKQILEIFESWHWTWADGKKPLNFLNVCWERHKEQLCIDIRDKFKCSSLDYYSNYTNFKIVSFNKFLKDKDRYFLIQDLKKKQGGCLFWDQALLTDI